MDYKQKPDSEGDWWGWSEERQDWIMVKLVDIYGVLTDVHAYDPVTSASEKFNPWVKIEKPPMRHKENTCTELLW